MDLLNDVELSRKPRGGLETLDMQFTKSFVKLKCQQEHNQKISSSANQRVTVSTQGTHQTMPDLLWFRNAGISTFSELN